MHVMRIHLQTLGCRLNEAELSSWAEAFHTEGHQLVADPGGADLVVVNTCAVTQEAVRKSRKLIRKARRDNPKARLVVSGCYVSLEPGADRESLGVDLVVRNADKDRLVAIASRELDLYAMPRSATEPGEHPLLSRGRQRAFVKVQDGCRYRCSFCIVTLARGEERSRATADVVKEVNALHRRGIREVVLTGVHLGGYGSDLGTDLPALIRALLTQTEIPRIRLGSLEPWELHGDFWALFDNPRLMPHLHLPLQSGADSVLRRMSRRCRAESFAALVEEARSRIPDFNVTTDIIVGFPGETDREWRQTLELVERIGFAHLHIFSYSPRAGTKAAALEGQVSPELKRRRSRELHALGQRLKRDTLTRYLGREFPVLVEGRSLDRQGGGRFWGGYTPNFIRVAIAADPSLDLQNRIRRVRLASLVASEEEIQARLLPD
jgi:threonylcarbamoyladenosine tRNA methylthiotransferase MtaB